MASDKTSSEEDTPQAALERARRFVARGNLKGASSILQNLLAVFPDNADALNWLAIIRSHEGKLDEAYELIAQAGNLAPEHAAIQNNLGNILVDKGEYADAAGAYARAVHLDPSQPDPLNNLGILMRAFGNIDDAENMFRAAVKLNPDFGLAHYNLSQTLGARARYREAVDHAYKASRNMPKGSVSPHVIAIAHMYNSDRDAALGVVRQWLEDAPGNQEALHVLAALEETRPPDRASDFFVESVFDRFAGSFDAKLADLGYRAPLLVADLVKSLAGDEKSHLRILDAGCGTGLCGSHVRNIASVLDGVDLSAKMLERARLTGKYDALHKSELTQFIADVATPYDVILSADTLCYFGALRDFTRAAQSALTESGLLVFTLEALDDDDAGEFRLSVTGRYQHSRAYVEPVLKESGFDIASWQSEPLRQENADWVPGHLVAARKR